jgi:DNA-directed RNA polymerase subunit K
VTKRSSVSRVSSEHFTRFEKARILGARALQISLGAPILVDFPTTIIDPLIIAEMEMAASVIPITVIHRDVREKLRLSAIS